jgi:hypothetical protein
MASYNEGLPSGVKVEPGGPQQVLLDDIAEVQRLIHQPEATKTRYRLSLTPDVLSRARKMFFDGCLDGWCACGKSVTVASYFVFPSSPDWKSHSVGCSVCAEESVVCAKFDFDHKRLQTWVFWCGGENSCICHACQDEAVPISLFDDWHQGHDEAKSVGGDDSALNVRPIHKRCNLQMATSSFEEFQGRLGIDAVGLIGSSLGKEKVGLIMAYLFDASGQPRPIELGGIDDFS